MIEAARMLDGQVPADAFLATLVAEGRSDVLADIAIRFENLARYGTLDVPLQLNDLGDGLYEIKQARYAFRLLRTSPRHRRGSTYQWVLQGPTFHGNEAYPLGASGTDGGSRSMTSLYAQLASDKKGARTLSAARLRYEVLRLLHAALRSSGVSQSELALRLGVRKSAVNQVLRGDGNVRVSTLADYLHELGQEVELHAVPLGRPREDAVRDMNRMLVRRSATLNLATTPARDLSAVRWNAVTGQTTIRISDPVPKTTEESTTRASAGCG